MTEAPTWVDDVQLSELGVELTAASKQRRDDAQEAMDES